MRERAPAKVNLCLYVGRPRPDGYHPIVSVIEPIALFDELTLEPDPSADTDLVVCPGVTGPNLAARAIELFRERTGWDGPPVRVTIDKRIPVAAGLGGGSSDAAATLRLLARHSGLAVPDDLAFALGADVPVLMQPARALVTRAGERVEPLRPTAPRAYVIVPSSHGLSAAEVYRRADELGTPRLDLGDLERAVRADPDGHHANDLAPAALDLLPEIADTMGRLRGAGLRPQLSGSGPTVFAIAPPGEADALAGRLGAIVVTGGPQVPGPQVPGPQVPGTVPQVPGTSVPPSEGLE